MASGATTHVPISPLGVTWHESEGRQARDLATVAVVSRVCSPRPSDHFERVKLKSINCPALASPVSSLLCRCSPRPVIQLRMARYVWPGYVLVPQCRGFAIFSVDSLLHVCPKRPIGRPAGGAAIDGGSGPRCRHEIAIGCPHTLLSRDRKRAITGSGDALWWPALVDLPCCCKRTAAAR